MALEKRTQSTPKKKNNIIFSSLSFALLGCGCFSYPGKIKTNAGAPEWRKSPLDILHERARFRDLAPQESEESSPHLPWICYGWQYPLYVPGKGGHPKDIILENVLWKAHTSKSGGGPPSEDIASLSLGACGAPDSDVTASGGICVWASPRSLGIPVFRLKTSRGGGGLGVGGRTFRSSSCEGARESGPGPCIVCKAAAQAQVGAGGPEDFAEWGGAGRRGARGPNCFHEAAPAAFGALCSPRA